MLEPQTLLILGIILLATFVNSTFGFGLGLIAMPLLAFILDLKTATPLVALIAATAAFFISLKNWREINFNNIWKLMITSCIGIPFGLYLLKGAGDAYMKIGLALMIIIFALYSLIGGVKITLKTDRLSYIVGFVAGIIGGAYNMGGPPIIVYGTLKNWSPISFRATLQSLFLPATIFIVLGHTYSGLVTSSVLNYYLYCFPVLVFTTVLGGFLNRSISTERFNRYIYMSLLVIGTFLLIKSFSV